MAAHDVYHTGHFEAPYTALEGSFYYDHYQTVDPSFTVYSASDDYSQQLQNFDGNWNSHSSNSMERNASQTTDSSSSTYPYPSSQEATTPVDIPDNHTHQNAKSKSRKSSTPKSAVKMLHCLSDRCEYRTTRQFDLERHLNTHGSPHADRLLDCPGRGCGRVGAYGFKRKDHLTEHLRKVHARDIPKGSSRSRARA